MKDPDDRFGMPESAFLAARESHGENNSTFRIGMYVPTRREVATREPDWLLWVLDQWMAESPTELIPSYDQIRAVRQVLLARQDADSGAVNELVRLCDEYLNEEDKPQFAELDRLQRAFAESLARLRCKK